MRSETTTCCIAGAGPAGMMAGLLVARAGVDVTVLEKHKNFFRDFRGDTIHPATLRILGVRPERVRTTAVAPLGVSGGRR